MEEVPKDFLFDFSVALQKLRPWIYGPNWTMQSNMYLHITRNSMARELEAIDT
jgi:hypothetical protein